MQDQCQTSSRVDPMAMSNHEYELDRRLREYSGYRTCGFWWIPRVGGGSQPPEC
jgi:hypothetical protein